MDDYESLNTRNGSACTTWCSYRSVDAARCTSSFGSTWEKCFAGWRNRRRVASRKAI